MKNFALALILSYSTAVYAGSYVPEGYTDADFTAERTTQPSVTYTPEGYTEADFQHEQPQSAPVERTAYVLDGCSSEILDGYTEKDFPENKF